MGGLPSRRDPAGGTRRHACHVAGGITSRRQQRRVRSSSYLRRGGWPDTGELESEIFGYAKVSTGPTYVPLGYVIILLYTISHKRTIAIVAREPFVTGRRLLTQDESLPAATDQDGVYANIFAIFNV